MSSSSKTPDRLDLPPDNSRDLYQPPAELADQQPSVDDPRAWAVAFAAIESALESHVYDLPLNDGVARPTDEQLAMVEKVLEEGDKVIAQLANDLFEQMKAQGITNVSDCFNAFRSFDAERAKIIAGTFHEHHPVFGALLKEITSILSDIIPNPATALALAAEDIGHVLTNHPTHYLSRKTPALLLIKSVKSSLEKAFVRLLQTKVNAENMPLIAGAKGLETPEVFSESLEISLAFKAMNHQLYLDMLANPLGKSSTGDRSKAEPYFRQRESLPEIGIQNNFGYVYLSEIQVLPLGFKPDKDNILPLTYYGKRYYAIPVGLYFEVRCMDEYAETIARLNRLVEQYKETPAAVYYQSLIRYYQFGSNSAKLERAQLIEDYNTICYDAEKAWVDYMRYAEEQKLPFVHLHPFETYDLPSTKTHELELAIVNHAQTEACNVTKKNAIENARRFYESAGLTAKYPEMIAKTLWLMESGCALALSTRIASSGSAIAQVIPNEAAGRERGVAMLFDIDYAHAYYSSAGLKAVEDADPIGDIADLYGRSVRDQRIFLNFFQLVTTLHEINHSAFKGKEMPYKSDGRGLPLKMVEEAKATNGLMLHFADPYNLTEEDMKYLREALPPEAIGIVRRMKPENRAEYTSEQYLCEGVVIMDHLFKAGVLEIAGIQLDAEGNPKMLPPEKLDDADFEFLRLNMGYAGLKAFVKSCADFNRSLAKPYHQVQFTPQLSPETIMPDRTDIDVWQALLPICIEEAIGAKVKGKIDDSLRRLETAAFIEPLSKLVPPTDGAMPARVRALLRYVDVESPQRLKAAVARVHGLDLNSSELQPKVVELQQKLRLMYPQVYGIEVAA